MIINKYINKMLTKTFNKKVIFLIKLIKFFVKLMKCFIKIKQYSITKFLYQYFWVDFFFCVANQNSPL